MTWRGRSVLVTGAGGFIGSHITERLVELGARTRAFIHYNSRGSAGWLDDSPARSDIEVITGDITDRDSLNRAFQGVDAVFHLAALIAIPYSYQSPVSYVRTNVEGTLNVLQCARDAGVSMFVHTSTSEVYGTAQYVPIDEKHPLQGQSPYSASKIGADKIAEAFRLAYGVPVITVRPFNTYGPRQSGRAIVPTIVTQGLAGGAVRLGNTSPSRDLMYVSDTVSGFLTAAEHPEAIGHTVNLGTGREVSIDALVRLLSRLMAKTLRTTHDEDRVRPPGSEVDRLVADVSLARRLLDWAPEVQLEDGLQRTIDWFASHHQQYRTDAYVI